MSLTNQLKNQHLMWRAGFGPAVEQLADLSKYSPKQIYKALIKASEKKPEYIDVADDYLKGLWQGIEEVGRMQKKEMDKDERKKVQQKNRESIRNLNMFWMYEMVNSSAQLREKLCPGLPPRVDLNRPASWRKHGRNACARGLVAQSRIAAPPCRRT